MEKVYLSVITPWACTGFHSIINNLFNWRMNVCVLAFTIIITLLWWQLLMVLCVMSVFENKSNANASY